jgi:hypothetical protein
VPKRNAAAFALNARRQLEAAFRSLPIFTIPRSAALLNYLTVLEAESVKAAVFSTDSTLTTFGAHRSAVESSTHAIPAIFEWCPEDPTLPTEDTEPAMFDLAYGLFVFTKQYDQIDYSYRLADRGHWKISVANKDPRITFSYASFAADEADTLARAREIQAKLSGDGWSLDQNAAGTVFEELRSALLPNTRLAKPETCEYVVNEKVLGVMRDFRRLINEAMPAGIDPNVKVGRYTFGDFRSWWCALISLIQTHTMAHDIACAGDVTRFPIRTIAINKPRKYVTELIGSVAEVPAETAEFILQCFVFDRLTNGRGPIIQPIFAIAEDHLCLSSLLVAFNDFDRNFFKLLHRSPLLLPFSASIDSQKEPTALRHLVNLFPEAEYALKDCVPIPGLTDADLLVYERSTGFVLVIQHKWITAPETPDESSSNDESLQKGVRQAIAARDYLRSNEGRIRQVLKLSSTTSIIARIECVTICRGLENTSFMEPSDVPVVTERVFEGLLEQAEDLGGLWTLLITRPDKTLAAEEAVDGKMKIKLGEFEFVMPALGF